MTMEQEKTVFSMEEDEILIDYVKNNEIIYNKNHIEYKNYQLKKRKWIDVGFRLCRTDQECKARWAHVRDYYKRKQGKPGTGSTGEAAKRQAVLLSFLDDKNLGKRDTINNFPRETLPCTEVEDLMVEVVNQVEGDHEVVEVEPSWENDMEPGTSYFADSPPPQLLPGQRKRQNKTATRSEDRLKLLKLMGDNIKLPEMDANGQLMSAMAKIMSTLPQLQQSRLRHQISNLVHEAEIEYLSKLNV
ncbi:hypothetical protein JTE90_024400 [Oedothorax gibbosus]|uniref:Transcription factor Adf-1 n=1 Tax=Oedothorax gibbosus TaxID=931172 RepID=A0AAV6TS46_9ARAC|nr:hypothetical protein JTE90_024400 [Oedothorax gibbosus]